MSTNISKTKSSFNVPETILGEILNFCNLEDQKSIAVTSKDLFQNTMFQLRVNLNQKIKTFIQTIFSEISNNMNEDEKKGFISIKLSNKNIEKQPTFPALKQDVYSVKDQIIDILTQVPLSLDEYAIIDGKFTNKPIFLENIFRIICILRIARERMGDPKERDRVLLEAYPEFISTGEFKIATEIVRAVSDSDKRNLALDKICRELIQTEDVDTAIHIAKTISIDWQVFTIGYICRYFRQSGREDEAKKLIDEFPDGDLKRFHLL